MKVLLMRYGILKTGPIRLSNLYTVYILRCNDNSLYIGITNNFINRLKQHNSGKGAKYTKGRTPLLCVYKETGLTKSEALKREYKLKRLTKLQKETLIAKENNHGDF